MTMSVAASVVSTVVSVVFFVVYVYGFVRTLLAIKMRVDLRLTKLVDGVRVPVPEGSTEELVVLTCIASAWPILVPWWYIAEDQRKKNRPKE